MIDEATKKEVAMLKIHAKSKMFVFSTVLAAALATMSATSVFAAPAAAPNGSIHSLATVWGSQFRELQADRAIYNNFKSHPGEFSSSSSPAEIQQYLNQYASALSHAEAIVLHGAPGSTLGVNVNSRSQKDRTAQQDLAMFLHMIRGLRAKLGPS
jgi:hypothetical protein